MTVMPLSVATVGFSRWFAEPQLATAGLAAFGLVSAGGFWAMLDSRLVKGERVALKPIRFALSIAVYMLTASWMLGYARPERLRSPVVQGVVWAMLAGASIELCCIVFQAMRGRRSHLNFATPSDKAISGIMAVMAILFIGMLLPIAGEVACCPRADASPLMIYAIVGGLIATFVLGAVTGAGMGRVAAGTDVADILRLPIVGWTIRGGRARIAHFLGIHAMQAFPLMAAGAQLLPKPIATILLVAGSLSYCAMALRLSSPQRPHVANAAAPLTSPAHQ